MLFDFLLYGLLLLGCSVFGCIDAVFRYPFAEPKIILIDFQLVTISVSFFLRRGVPRIELHIYSLHRSFKCCPHLTPRPRHTADDWGARPS